MDGWDFKTYMLGMLFYRFISKNLTAYLNRQERKVDDTDFDYASLNDADAEFGHAETVKTEELEQIIADEAPLRRQTITLMRSTMLHSR